MRFLRRTPLFPALLLVVSVLRAQHGNITVSNPFATPADAAAGARSFLNRCASCHGKDGRGSTSGPDLTTGNLKRGNSEDEIFRVIEKGVPGTAMPAFPLNGREIWQLITYMRTLGFRRGAELTKGDAANGAKLFAAQGCAQCHTAAEPGGFLGPDLTEIGARRSLGHLERAVLDPNADVSEEYWSVRVRTKRGQTLNGIRLNEDTYTLQLRDATGRLWSLPKDELASFEMIRTSPMPSFQGKLRQNEVDDLVAYLASLRGAPPAEPEAQGTTP